MAIEKKVLDALHGLCKEALAHAYSPYSGMKVAAALLTQEEMVFTGVNVENSSFGLTCCAERTAIFKAISEGFNQFRCLALTMEPDHRITPCGACRQVLNEFAPDLEIYLVSPRRPPERLVLSQLLPDAFSPRDVVGKSGSARGARTRTGARSRPAPKARGRTPAPPRKRR